MDTKSRGLILRVRPLTDSSLIVHWLTPDYGRLSTVAKGARRPQSAFRGKLDLFYDADFAFQFSRRSDLHILREVTLRATHPALRQDLDLLRQAAYATQLVELATERETPLPVVFELVDDFLRRLASPASAEVNILAFEARLLAELGLFPALDNQPLQPGSKSILLKWQESSGPLMNNMALSSEQVREISQFLLRLLAGHLDRLPKGRAAFLDPRAPHRP